VLTFEDFSLEIFERQIPEMSTLPSPKLYGFFNLTARTAYSYDTHTPSDEGGFFVG
jgi:hypothetical protein